MRKDERMKESKRRTQNEMREGERTRGGEIDEGKTGERKEESERMETWKMESCAAIKTLPCGLKKERKKESCFTDVNLY